jgi:hypothetical protein
MREQLRLDRLGARHPVAVPILWGLLGGTVYFLATLAFRFPHGMEPKVALSLVWAGVFGGTSYYRLHRDWD